jgi:hypothetical protein
MKRNTTAFLIIALAAELGTTWFQKLRTVTDVAPGLYYPSFETLLIGRLVVWFIIVAVLGTIWLLISKRTMRD